MQAAIGAQQSQASQQALAGKVLANANALASAVWASGTATVASGSASVQAAANTLAASFGMYHANLPVGPSLPTISQQAVDAVMLNDYTAPAVNPCYAGILGNMFGTRTVEPEPTSGIEASVWSESLSGSTISGDLARLMNPQQETRTVGGVVQYFNELAPPHFDATTGQRNLTAQYAAATVTIANPIGSASEETLLCNTGKSGPSGRALVNVNYDLATGRSVVQLAIPTASISNATAIAWNINIASYTSSDGSDSIVAVCFAAGTPVLLADGTTKPIEQIERGDNVRAASHEDPEGPISAGEVAEVYHNGPRNLVEVEVGGQVIRVTPKHPFYVRGRSFTAAANLRR